MVGGGRKAVIAFGVLASCALLQTPGVSDQPLESCSARRYDSASSRVLMACVAGRWNRPRVQFSTEFSYLPQHTALVTFTVPTVLDKPGRDTMSIATTTLPAVVAVVLVALTVRQGVADDPGDKAGKPDRVAMRARMLKRIDTNGDGKMSRVGRSCVASLLDPACSTRRRGRPKKE